MSYMDQGSGTSLNPSSAPMSAIHVPAGSWMLMFHGQLVLADIQQLGARGGDKLFAPNWWMGMAEHPVGDGSFLFRSMLSLEPATITDRRYPLLFQTGETAYGRPLVDAQHPHDFVMELSVQYKHPLTDTATLQLCYAPVGDPALGPVAFPHRASAAELPQATLSHHWQDSTHIANQVVTAGISTGLFLIEASGFHGAEPNENRWNIDYGMLDSWAARLTVTPGENWSAQVSAGRLNKPEFLERGDVVRTTASVAYNRPLAAGNWASSLVWGRNHNTGSRRDMNSYLAESVVRFQNRNYVTGRVELVDKDELFTNDPQLEDHLARVAGSTFRVKAFTLGYTRDVLVGRDATAGLGANFTTYSIPAAVQPYYGIRPWGILMYLRVRLGR